MRGQLECFIGCMAIAILYVELFLLVYQVARFASSG